jgi:hypothetical protein
VVDWSRFRAQRTTLSRGTWRLCERTLPWVAANSKRLLYFAKVQYSGYFLSILSGVPCARPRAYTSHDRPRPSTVLMPLECAHPSRHNTENGGPNSRKTADLHPPATECACISCTFIYDSTADTVTYFDTPVNCQLRSLPHGRRRPGGPW